ncbi:hypothetical protein HQO83_13345 [Rhodococcus fascians]|nr:hypothetical protein [Rhodococcus fascians]
MPPQRRKIVPPTTTSKVRRKVAGTAKPMSAETDTAAATETGVASTPDAVAKPDTRTNTTAAKTTAPETAGPEGGERGTSASVATAAASNKPRLDKTPSVQAQPDTEQPDKPSTAKAGLNKPVAPVSGSTGTVESPTRSSGIGFKHVIVVAIIAVVLGAFAAVAAFKPFATIDNKAWVDSSSTQEVTSAATDALQILYTYKAATIDADFDAARAVLNQSMLDEFNSTADTTKSAVVQTDTGTEAMVTDIGVVRLEDDKAELLANVNISATQNGVASGSAEGPLTVNMEKVDGTWKLSAIDDQ